MSKQAAVKAEAKQVAVKIEAERSNFRSLLVKNPNYFDKLPKAKTKYEELTCVGFNPAKNLLEATVAVKLSYGYGGSLCGAGTTEYVRFFVDYGAGWEDVGLAGFTVHDIPNGRDCAGKPDKPLMYIATLKYQPKTDCCNRPVLPKVRAILSWQWIPPANNANWPPPWGNMLECNIQVSPYPWNIYCLLEVIGESIGQKIKLPPMFEAVKYNPFPIPDPPPFTLAELAQMYMAKTKSAQSSEKMKVDAHRFGLQDIHAALAVGGFKQEIVSAKMAEWKALNLDWAVAVAALDATKADVSYEELECLGIDNTIAERLVATFRIKRPTGYNGNLCTKGSIEFVAFWADWDNTCQWSYLGTAQVRVHDIPDTAKKKDLCYSAILPVDLTYVRRSCQKPKIARIRAVLSWNVPPSTTDPDALTHWGNRLDVHVQINPGDVVDPEHPTAKIRNIGGIPVEDIDITIAPNVGGMTIPSAVFAHYPYYPADHWNLGRRCPFGGRITVEGNYYLGYYYRVRVRKQADPVTTLTTLYKDFYVERADVGFDHQVPTIDGWFTFLDPIQEFDRTLALWDSYGDDLWEMQLDVSTSPSESGIIASSPWYRIQLDNAAPAADIHIAAGGDCKTFQQGGTIMGTFVADDLHFGGWSLDTLPSQVFGVSSNQPTASGLANTDPAPSPSGHSWSLNTASPNMMPPCGYVVRLRVWDRTIVHSLPGLGYHNGNGAEVGLCLREKT